MKGSKMYAFDNRSLESKLSCKSILEHCTLETVFNSMIKDQSSSR